jgi:hypothetical protein
LGYGGSKGKEIDNGLRKIKYWNKKKEFSSLIGLKRKQWKVNSGK